MRKTERFQVENTNSLWQIYKTVSFIKVMKNFIFIQIARYTPFLGVKNWLYRVFLRMKIGMHKAFALIVMSDIMFSEKFTVESNNIIVYNTTILVDEYFIK